MSMNNQKRAGLFFMILALLLFNISCQRDQGFGIQPRISSKIRPKAKPSYFCPFDGVKVKGRITRRPVAVMVENLRTVRPQSGLSEACVVFEALAEGGITRFLALYGHNDTQEVGPVRSARTYYVALARGFDAIYAHCGASITALDAIKQWEISDLDQFRYSQAYWRVKGISPPHNLYTSISKIREVAEQAGLEVKGVLAPWSYKNDKPISQRPSDQNLIIGFSTPAYQVEFNYDRNSNTYLRKNGGEPHLDRANGKQLAAKNVIVLFASTSYAAAGSGLLDINIIGEGKALVFRDGEVEEGIWHKTSIGSPLRFLGLDGKELKFNRGQIWVEIVKTDTPVSYHTVPEKGEES